MTQPSIVVEPRGLQTNPSQLLAGGGGLSTCNNALCRRPGMVEPRGGFSVTASPSFSAGNYTITEHVAPYSTDYYLVASDGSSTSCITKNVDYANRLSLAQANLTPRSATLGQSLALSLDGGIRMIDTAGTNGSAINRFCGIPRPSGPLAALQTPSATAAQNWIANGYQTAYRILYRRTINGRDYYGPPSERLVINNGTGAATYPNVSAPILSYMTGWYVEIYRSPTQQASGTPPSDEMRLLMSHLITSSEAAAGIYTLADTLSDSAWSGATIYTAGTQQGVAKSYFAPGYANDVTTYNGMTFLGGARRGYNAQATLKAMGDGNDPTQTLVSVKLGATTNSTTTVSGLTAAALSYLAVGQIVTLASNTSPGSSDATFPAACKIVSINTGAATMVISAAATTTGAVTIVAWDWIKVTGTNASRYVYASWIDKVGATTFALSSYADSTTRTKGVFSVVSDTAVWGIVASGHEIERAFGTLSPVTSSSVEIRCYAVDDPTQPRYGSLITFAESVAYDTGGATTLGTNTFTVTSTKPSAFSVSWDATTGATSTIDGGANILAWSELDKPESFPLPNYVPIGSASNIIDRVAVGGDSLFVFTREGIWRIYGVTPDALSPGQWDPTARTFSGTSGWVTRYGDSVYAWTQRGVVQVNGSGVQNVDAAIQDQIRAYGPNPFSNALVGTYAGTDEQNGMVVFGAQGSLGGAICYVYLPLVGTWSTFGTDVCGSDFTLSTATRDANGAIVFGTSGECGFAQYVELPFYDTLVDGYPQSRCDSYNTNGGYTLPTISSASGVHCVVSSGSTVQQVNIGDVIVQGLNKFYVVDVDANITLHTAGIVNGAITALYKSYTSQVSYVASTEGLPMMEKRYDDVTLNFGVMRYGRTFDVETMPYGVDTSTTQTVLYDPTLTTYTSDGGILSMVTRRSVPRDQGRSVALKVTYTIQQALAYWSLFSLCVTYDPTTSKVNRGQS